MNFQNPIIPGMHPDPSICRVGDDYFLVNSSFEYFPGIPVFHSKDLVHWVQIGHCIEREEQLTLRRGFPGATGLYAPTIRYDQGTFYVVCTNVAYGGETDGNFFVWTKDPFAPKAWSDPIRLDTPGIDPSFYIEDGHFYYTGCADEQIYLCEIDPKTGKYVQERKNIWPGTGSCSPEGPHLYKINGTYYLMISEGGTELTHMVTIARSSSIWGPYESYEQNPILSNRGKNTEIKATGHADLIQDPIGNWWAVCLGIRCISYPFKHNLGRETMLMPVHWNEEGWPVLATDGILEESYPAPDLVSAAENISNNDLAGTKEFFDDFSASDLHVSWNFIYHPQRPLWQTGTQEQPGLSLTSNGNPLNADEGASFLGRRQEHHVFRAETKVSLPMKEDGEEAGLTIYLNHKHHYEIAFSRRDGKNVLFFRRQLGTLIAEEHQTEITENEVVLALEGTKEIYAFSYSLDGEHFTKIGEGEAKYLTTEVGGMFTGNYIGLYVAQAREEKKCTGQFHYFQYTGE